MPDRSTEDGGVRPTFPPGPAGRVDDFGDDPAVAPAVVGGNVETSQRLVDTLLRALDLCACSQGTMNNVIFGNESYGFYETLGGGAGATADAHGADAIHTHMTNTRITDAEILEFARSKYGATFPMFSKIEVNGDGACDLYRFLKSGNPDEEGNEDIAAVAQAVVVAAVVEAAEHKPPRTASSHDLSPPPAQVGRRDRHHQIYRQL